MPRFALASRLHLLSPDQIARLDHIICDDGDWTPEQIAAYISRWHSMCVLTDPTCDDWIGNQGANLP